MDRRTFNKIAALVAVGGMVPFLTGCSSWQDLVNIALASAQKLLAVIPPGTAGVAQLQAAITELQAAQSEGTVAKIRGALDLLAAAAALIPFTAIYSPLIDILVAGIDAALSLLPQTTQAAAPLKQSVSSRPRFNHHNKVKVNDWLGKPSTAVYTNKWNKAVSASPALAAATL